MTSTTNCIRYIKQKGVCGKPVEFTFVDKNQSGQYLHYGLCKQHSAEAGVKRV